MELLRQNSVRLTAVHLQKHKAGLHQKVVFENPYRWSSSSIAEILKKYEYPGHTVNFKTRKHFKDKKSHYVDESEWVIFENTQEPIIDRQTFDTVQKIRKNVRRYPNGWGEVAPLTGLLFCADCGGKMYEDNILGKLSDSRYVTLDAQYEKEQSELTAEISALEKAVKSYEKHEKDADRFIALIDKYENLDKLTIAMLNEFIEKILVHERARKGSTDTTQEVEIYYNFIGRFVPPDFVQEPTPEEIEEMRKKDELKDRLHRNYLRRKENGKQKEYEERIKAKKKAEIDEKKNALRAEDIQKGVFVPVSSLPQREPQKGTQIA